MTSAQVFLCPECDEPVEPPRKLFFGPGEHEVECPNGHTFVLINRVRTEDE